MKLRLVLVYTAAMFVAPLVATAAAPLPPAADAALRQSIKNARSADASPFVAVNGIIAKAADAHTNARSHKAPVAQTLVRLGPNAVLPVLELLAVDPPKGVPAPLLPVVRRDLIEAAGLLGDSQAVPVLIAILSDAAEDNDTTRTTAEALSRIGTDDAAQQLLTSLAGAASGPGSGDRARALVAGMGECRRATIADALAARLAGARNDDAMAQAAARSLGRAGNAWAWKTLADHSEETRIRETAARALVQAFAAHEGDARMAASNALMVVDAPITPSLIAEARSKAPPATQAALDTLAARFAANPTR